jgi:acyl-CoA reductase-like NAD-dependent aldehyde dehydrogenase
MYMLINGQKRLSTTGQLIPVCNPADNRIIDSVPDASKSEVAEAVLHSLEGAKAWKQTPLFERAAIVKKFCSLIDSHTDELAELQTREMGKPISQSLKDFTAVKEIFLAYSEAAKTLVSEVMPLGGQAGKERDLEFTIREPLGTVVCIVPFNGPLVLFAYKAAPALIMGNAVVAKPTSDNPLTLLRLGELMLEAGIPGNVLQLVTGRGSTVGSWLVEDPRISKVSFTGSMEVGISVAKATAANLVKSSLELGGNSPFILLEDGDTDLAVKDAVFSRVLSNNGQICNTAKRFIIHTSKKEEFIKKLISELEKLNIGNPMDPDTQVGCLISEKAAIEVEAQVQKTIEQGASLICGGIRNGSFYTPAVLDNAAEGMDIAHDMEVFGPVFPVIEFKEDHEAIRIANSTIFGLGCGVYTSSIQRAMRFSMAIESGSVIVNGSSYYRSLLMPFGGYKKSGLGREGLLVSLKEMSQVKSVVFRDVL